MTSDSRAFYSQNAARINTFDVICACLAGFLDNKEEDFFDFFFCLGVELGLLFCLGLKGRNVVMNINCGAEFNLIYLQNLSRAHQLWIRRFCGEEGGMKDSGPANKYTLQVKINEGHYRALMDVLRRNPKEIRSKTRGGFQTYRRAGQVDALLI